MKLRATINVGAASENRTWEHLPVRIGRAEDNDVVLGNLKVSRYHGIIDADERGCFYNDLGSTNGSFIRHQGSVLTPVETRTYLRPGDEIVFGGDGRSSLVVEAVCDSRWEATVDATESNKGSDPLLATVLGEIGPEGEYERLAGDPARVRSILDFIDGLSRAATDSGEILSPAGKLVLDLSPAVTDAAIYLRSESGWQEGAAAYASGDTGCGFKLSRVIGRKALETGRGFLFRPADPPFCTDSILGAGIEIGACVPLTDRHGVRGIVQLGSRKTDQCLNSDDLRLFAAAARHVAVALENAELSEHLRAKNATLATENAQLRKQAAQAFMLGGIIGRSKAMSRCPDLVAKVIPAETSVLSIGETGIGKELIARAIHFNGPRKDKPLVVQDCGALAESLLESELFGHNKGSFTGALEDKPGLFEVADGGTIFLDEIGDCSPALQTRLLRVLQEGEVKRVGDLAWRKVNVRIIAATNRNLEEQIRKGLFREDLYYRLSVFPIIVPPLRERREDIPMLVSHFLERIAARSGKKLGGITKEALDCLLAYPFPGNVRELENEIGRAAILVEPGGVITADILSGRLRATGGDPDPGVSRAAYPPDGQEALHRVPLEPVRVVELLKRHAGNLTRVARALGTSRLTLYKWLREFGIDHRDYY